MSKPALRLNVLVASFPYAGNGGFQAEHPDVREWALETLVKANSDPRVGEISFFNVADTPITMTRSRAVAEARRRDAHLLLMIDSDMAPFHHRGESWYRPFWDVAFQEIYDHYGRGPLVVGAPYAGPPPYSNCYVFKWETTTQPQGRDTGFELAQYPRQEAATMRGVSEVGALPTGLILYDMRAFELIEPSKLNRRDVLEQFRDGKLTMVQSLAALNEGWFRYEWADQTAVQKGSTEDVQNTRDISLACLEKHGYNPLRCSWDSWAGHWKPWCVGRPQVFDAMAVSASLREIVLDKHDAREGTIDLSHHFQDFLKGKEILEAPPEDGAPANDIVNNPWEVAHLTEGELSPMVNRMAAEILNQHVMPPAHTQAVVNLCKWLGERDWPITKILEVGCFKGDTTIAIAKEFPNARVYAVDHFKGSESDHTSDLVALLGGPGKMWEVFRQVVKDSGCDNITMCNMSSEQAAGCVEDRLDLVFIDADHSYEAVWRDIELWLPKVRQGGFLCGHDFWTDQFPGVTKAVLETFGSDCRVQWFDNYGGVWCHRVGSQEYPPNAREIPAEFFEKQPT